MRSLLRVVPRVAAAMVVIGLSPHASGWAAEAVGRPAVRCQQTITTGAHAFVARQLSDLARCVGASLSCAETAPEDGECLPASRARCERTIARILRREGKLAHIVATRCAAVDVAVLLDEGGLGFAGLSAFCPALGTGHGDADVLGDCLARLVRCRGERLFATAFPRAGELLRVAGVAAPARAALSCLPDRGGSGRGARDAEVGTLITRCARTAARASAHFTTRTLANASRCTRATEACLGTSDDGECLTAATDTCAGAFGRIAGARSFFGRAVVGACGADRIDFGALAAPSGVNLDALADECAAVQVDPVAGASAMAECLVRRHECELAELVRHATPRAAELFALVGQSIEYPHCVAPAPSETPTPEATSTPTATTTGPTRTPRPGETATPTPRATPTVSRTASPQPTATPFCGNGEIDDGEECDGDQLDDNTCEDLCFEVGPHPTLICTDCRFDFSQCGGVDCEAP